MNRVFLLRPLPLRSTRGGGSTRRLMFAAGVSVCAMASGGDFADSVIEYRPAPGQFVNNALFNDPSRALGAPVGGGTAAPSNAKVVSLGGFGGSITLRFSARVMDDPCNPFGMDAIVFSNALWQSGDPNRRWAEAAVIEVCRDSNGNGVPDDGWFVIRGSHLGAVPADRLEAQAWDNNAGTATPPGNVAWYPSAVFYPGFPAMYATETYRLPGLFETSVLVNPNGPSATAEGAWGYGELSPTLVLGDLDGDNIVDDAGADPGEFYTAPDNPFAVGVTAGSGGGDAFDIEWAVDPLTGAPAGLDGFDFVRLSTGVSFIAGVLGELSAEISAVADVRARESFFDRTGDGDADVDDLYAWEAARDDVNGDGVVSEADRGMMMRCVRRAE